MKKIILLTVCLITLAGCSYFDDEYITIYANDLITVQTLDSYTVGDKLTIKAEFSKLQMEDNYSNPLDIFQTTKDDSFRFSFYLQKKVFNGSYVQINLSDSDFEDGGKGYVYSGTYPDAICVLNQSTGNYEFNQSIILQEAGSYQLVIYPDISNSSHNSVFDVTIHTNVVNMDSYSLEFEVE